MFDKDLKYWQNKLSRLPVLELTTDKLKSSDREYDIGIETFVFPQELYSSIKNFSQSSDTLIFTNLLTAFKCLLYKYTGQEDIIVGSYIPQSNNSDFNKLAFRSCISGNIPFIELLKQVNGVVTEDLKHQDFSWEQLVNQLNITNSQNDSGIFQVMFSLQDANSKDIRLPIDIDEFKLDLSLICS